MDCPEKIPKATAFVGSILTPVRCSRFLGTSTSSLRSAQPSFAARKTRAPKPVELCPSRVAVCSVAASETEAVANSSVIEDSEDWDVIVVGSGFGGLCTAAITTALGMKTLILESHYSAGGVAHGFEVKNAAGVFKFDTGPSFYCGLSTAGSLNPVKHALDAIGESVSCVPYGRTGYLVDDLSTGKSIRVCESEKDTLASIELSAPGGSAELKRFNDAMRAIHRNMTVPSIALRSDWKVLPVIFRRWALQMAGLLPHVGDVKQPVSKILDRVGVVNPIVRRYLDTEAFLLSGLKTDKTITAEIAFMVGERETANGMEYPVGGARAIVDALVRGIENFGGGRSKLALNSHVEIIEVERGEVTGVLVRGRGKQPKKRIRAKTVISNASGWDTFAKGENSLVLPQHLPKSFVTEAKGTPAVESFMHAHIAIPSDGLAEFDGHHAVTIDSSIDIAEPGNTVMISVPTMWSPDLAPPGWHVIHAYTLNPFDGWTELKNDKEAYAAAKKAGAEPLFTAIRSVIPDLDRRLEHPNAVVKLGSPLTHARFVRRHQGSYGPAIAAGQAEFPWPGTPISGLYRVGDTVFPGIGVPAAAASGIIAATSLVSVREHNALVDRVFPK